MPKILALAAPLADQLQKSKYRVTILRLLLRLDNSLRRWITFFAFENGTHPKHRLTRYHDFFLEHIQKHHRVLDVGCGLGMLAAEIAQKAQQVTGIDYNQDSINRCHRTYAQPNLHFIYGDALTHAFNEQFDAVVLSNVLEHIEDRVAFLKKLAALAPKLLIRVPMFDRDWVVPLKKELGIEYRLDPTHFTEYTEPEFRHDAAAAGLRITTLSVRFGELYAVVEPTT